MHWKYYVAYNQQALNNIGNIEVTTQDEASEEDEIEDVVFVHIYP